MKNVRLAASLWVGEGVIRAALAGTVLLILSLWWSPQDVIWAYLAAGSAAVFGLLVVLKPGAIYRWRIAHAAGDALVVSVIVADTGGAASAFFPLYLLAALSLVKVVGRARDRGRARVEGFAGAAVLVGGYLLATLAAGGWDGPSSPPFALRMVILVLLCASALLVDFEARALRERAAELSAAAAGERERAGRAKAQSGALGPALGGLGIELALDYVAEAACAVAGARYAHVASLRGNFHRTVMRGEFDACPSWWHPSVQRLVLWSCREGGAVRLEEKVHGVEGFVAVPVGAGGQEPGGENWGAIVVGGGRGGAEVERDLIRLAADVRPALERCPDAAGGSDLLSGLANAESLARALRQDLSAGAPPVLLAVRLRGGASTSSTEDLLCRLAERLRIGGRRAFRYGVDILVILANVNGEAQAAEKARALLRIVNDESKGSVGSPVQAEVGFALPGTLAKSPDELVATALLALGDARGKEEKIAGAVVGARELSGAAAASVSPPLVQGFVKAMVARDPYLAGHSAGVSRVAGRIGRALSLDPEQLEALAVGALLHDIGKIGIPDRILHKPGRLTDGEYAVIKRHPKIGSEIVATIRELSAALPAIRHHHERFDGLGYPDGLRAEKIPLVARVVAVADAFDSMTRERPYGRRMSAGAALEEILRRANTQFDPRVAEALSQVALGPDDPRADDLAV
ncbi:MAG: HD-GYP domain-containing protein [Rubrobacter sp.]